MKSPKIENEVYTEPPYRSKIRRDFMLFIDHLDNEDNRIWAVKVKNGPYLTAREIQLHGPMKAHKLVKEQPRAYITGTGFITQMTAGLIVIEC